MVEVANDRAAFDPDGEIFRLMMVGVTYESRIGKVLAEHGGQLVEVGDPRLNTQWSAVVGSSVMVFPSDESANIAYDKITMGIDYLARMVFAPGAFSKLHQRAVQVAKELDAAEPLDLGGSTMPRAETTE